jgi:hypothetical protein
MNPVKRIAVSCTDLEEYFFRDGKGRLTPVYQNAIIDLADFPSTYFPYTDFPCEAFDFQQEDRVYELIVESELYLSREKRYSCWNAYKALLKALWSAASDSPIQLITSDSPTIESTFSAREHIDRINKEIRLLPNPTADAPALLRNEFSRFINLFRQSPYADEVLQMTRKQITHKILDRVWEGGADADLPFGRIWSVENIKAHPYDYRPDGDIWTWEGFWEATNPLLNDYIEALNYQLLYRWIQCKIASYEKPAQTNHPPKAESVRNEESGVPPNNDAAPFTSFTDLFFQAADIKLAVDALRKIRPEKPLLTTNGHWITRKKDGSKGILVAWIERLENTHKIRVVSNRKALVSLLNAYFPGLDMGGSARTFGDPTEESIRLGFISLIPK